MKIIFFLALVLATVQGISATAVSGKDCVLDVNGVEKCTDGLLALPSTVRQSAPCEKMDMKCWCMKAKDYTNDVRRRRGMSKMLNVGPMKQLDNANRYAGVLGNKGFLEHQDLGMATSEVGCGRWIGGENIAYNYESGDIAKACVDQWEKSAGHLENILRDWFEEVVIGFHFESDGRVYCVQTFSAKQDFGTSGSDTDARCESVSSGGSGPTPTEPAPTKPVSTTPVTTMPARTGPAPTAPTMSSRSRNEGNRSCRCIELGTKCWGSLRRLSGNRCEPFIIARNQPKKCTVKCCSYCEVYPRTPPCRSSRVKYICRNL